jgi:hypothetical protein
MTGRCHSPGKVVRAIRGALDLCSRSPFPLQMLTDFEKRLRADQHWNDAEVKVFDSAMRRILARCQREQVGD